MTPEEIKKEMATLANYNKNASMEFGVTMGVWRTLHEIHLILLDIIAALVPKEGE